MIAVIAILLSSVVMMLTTVLSGILKVNTFKEWLERKFGGRARQTNFEANVDGELVEESAGVSFAVAYQSDAIEMLEEGLWNGKEEGKVVPPPPAPEAPKVGVPPPPPPAAKPADVLVDVGWDDL